MSSALQKLPQFPRPTHDVVVRYWPPTEFEVLLNLNQQVGFSCSVFLFI